MVIGMMFFGKIIGGIVEENKEWHHIVTIEELEGLKRKIQVTYDEEAVTMAFNKSCDIVAKQVQIKGFRKGKAPKQMVELQFHDKIKEVAGSLLSQEGFLHACFEHKITPLEEPVVENINFLFDGTFTCDIFVEIKPIINPPIARFIDGKAKAKGTGGVRGSFVKTGI